MSHKGSGKIGNIKIKHYLCSPTIDKKAGCHTSLLPDRNMHIAIAGNIGSGKTSLTRMLAHHYGWTPKFETVAENPYLSDYYADIHRWAFNMEVFYLWQRFRDLLAISHCEDTVVQDRSIFEGVYVFTVNNHAMGNLDDRDFETYMELFECMMSMVSMPDLMVYLQSPLTRLVDHIRQRGRSYEQKMPLEYLENLNRLYDDFIFHKYKGRKLVIKTDTLDFRDNPLDFKFITDQIDACLTSQTTSCT